MFVAYTFIDMTATAETRKVAVIGATGRVGREVVKLLVSRGISVACLVRFDPPPSSRTSLNPDATSYEVAEYLSSLEKVELGPSKSQGPLEGMYCMFCALWVDPKIQNIRLVDKFPRQ